ncbi:D-2-hydroxyacid dehydrogenase family protein [Streptomyces sp. 8ZJF_21]|uniref:D-2-hydroxyacid dehydrogenase family protein n=1 Tax=Streptomyces sp. 8ZJF_21 TaxID=2903141 RepID=UPI001E656D2D|nr:D-2-hydroxyacid dehydrogenase family protein [Streptomyces sp. 8ZJF_21]MCD9587371.1 D-2-hydroxyacid dehydrogenase family protein [Streptomyces sp. 8ZJF_21]
MKLRCAVLDDYQDVALSSADWSGVLDAVDVVPVHEYLAGEDAVAEAIGDCEIVVIMRERTPFRASLFARLPKLRLLVTTGMRNASVDLEAAARHGVTVCGTGGAAQPTAELTWALILGLARHVVPESTAVRDGGPWQSTVGTDLYGRRLGLLGLGRIGTQVARVGRAFGMEVAAWSANLTAERAEAAGVRAADSKEELLESSDIVSVHLVLGDRTRGLLGAPELRRMRPTALLVNTSRAAIVDQTALARALRDGWIAGAAVDVFEHEPLPPGDPFRTLPHLLATPHLGYVTRANYERFYGDVVEDIHAYLQGAPIRRLSPPEPAA